jgi:hypothetical protein
VSPIWRINNVETWRTVVEIQKRNHDGLGYAAQPSCARFSKNRGTLGWLDDGVMAILLFKLAFKLLPKEMYESLKAQYEQKGGKVDDVTFAKSRPIKPSSTKTKVDDVVDVKAK